MAYTGTTEIEISLRYHSSSSELDRGGKSKPRSTRPEDGAKCETKFQTKTKPEQ